jgi:hypothetical protein
MHTKTTKPLGRCEALNVTHAFGYEPGEACGDDGCETVCSHETRMVHRTVCFTHREALKVRSVAFAGELELTGPNVLDQQAFGHVANG